MLVSVPTATPAGSCADLVRRGRITEALALLTEVPDRSVDTLAWTLECRLARGEMVPAASLGEQLAGLRGLSSGDAARVELALGDLAAAAGRDEDALTHFLAAGERFDDPVELPWRSGAALALMRTGSRREAGVLATEQLALARADGSAYAVAAALRTAAACLAADPPHRLREAYSLAVGRYHRLTAQIATDLAGLLALTPPGDADVAEAVSLLRAAEVYVDAEDLWPLHTRVRRLLERLGETAQVPRTETIARLTQSELRVARLAGMGLSNRAIAEDVGVTVKAVEWHLSHTYRKLGINGRGGLPQALRLG